MKNTRIYILALGVLFSLLTGTTHAQVCDDFEAQTLSEIVPTSQVGFGVLFYTDGLTSLVYKYEDYSGLGDPGSVTIGDHVAAGYTGGNGSTNYSGNIFYQGNAAVQAQFNTGGVINRKIEFDINYIYHSGENNPFIINGQPSNAIISGVTYTETPLANGYHVEIEGPIFTMQFYGFEIGVDNFCIENLPDPVQNSGCYNFSDTTLSQTIPTTQITYGAPWQTFAGAEYRSKYFDYSGLLDPGTIDMSDHVAAGYTGANGCTNFSGPIFYQGNAITQADFASTPFTSKIVEFDINYIPAPGQANPFMVNGQVVTALPAGISYSETPLTNGYHITLTGDISTLEFRGFEIGIDNMCVDSLVNPPSSVYTGDCIEFENNTLSVALPASQTSYGPSLYSEQGVDFRMKMDLTSPPNPSPIGVVDNHVVAGFTGANGNSNFSGNIFYQAYAMTIVDLTAIPFAAKSIEFDVNFIQFPNQSNPFFVNGQGISTLPSGVTYSATPLQNGYHITLTGDISSFELAGYELAIDNICIQPEQLSLQQPNSAAVIITPDYDGNNDNLLLPAGARVFDRNGVLVFEATQETVWNGTNNSNQQLPMGAYFVFTQAGEKTDVTIIR